MVGVNTMKLCRKCNRKKEVDAFNKNPTKPDGLHHCCRECQTEYVTSWYQMNKEQIKRNGAISKNKTRQLTEQKWWSTLENIRVWGVVKQTSSC